MGDAILLNELHTYINLQKTLVSTFLESHPNVRDFEYLIDVPKSGLLEIDGECWSFSKHGTGLTFESQNNVVINAHRHLNSPELFDSWRILLYLESMRKIDEDVYEEDIETSLVGLASEGKLIKVSERLFRLND